MYTVFNSRRKVIITYPTVRLGIASYNAPVFELSFLSNILQFLLCYKYFQLVHFDTSFS